MSWTSLSATQLLEELGFELKQSNRAASSDTLPHFSITYRCCLSLKLIIQWSARSSQLSLTCLLFIVLGVSPGLIILLSIWRDISKQNKIYKKQTKVNNNKNKTPQRPELPWQQPMSEGNAVRQRAGLQTRSTASQKKVLAYKPLCTYMYTHTYTHPLTHRPTHIPTVMHSTIFKVYTSISYALP